MVADEIVYCNKYPVGNKVLTNNTHVKRPIVTGLLLFPFLQFPEITSEKK